MANAEINKKKNTITRECIVLALKRLLARKVINEITVSELVQTAGISRTTFYRNYHSISDVLRDYFDRYPFGALSPFEYSKEGFYLHNRLVTSFTFLYDNRELIYGMLRSDLAMILYDNYDDLMKGLYKPRVVEMGFKTEYEQSAAAGLYFGICYDWIKGGMKETPNEMADISYHILSTYHVNA